MFYVLGSSLCLAVFFLVLAGSWLVCGLALRRGEEILPAWRAEARANLLFGLRVLPAFLAVLITLGLALPAFLVFEPRLTKEALPAHLLTLAVLGAAAFTLSLVRGWRVVRTTQLARKQWRDRSTPARILGAKLPVYRVPADAPLLAVTGILRPEIFVASAVMERLSSREIRAALAHELGHVSAWDNLKRLLLKATVPPGFLGALFTQDAAWRNASEIAADERALAGGVSALDLSSALVKVARIGLPAAPGSDPAVSHFAPTVEHSCIETRIQRLRKLLDAETPPARDLHGGTSLWLPLSLAILALCYGISIQAVLPWMHETLEFLVR